ncbi:uncharacterized protein LOC144316013 isoform X2 [Canis aureus]
MAPLRAGGAGGARKTTVPGMQRGDSGWPFRARRPRLDDYGSQHAARAPLLTVPGLLRSLQLPACSAWGPRRSCAVRPWLQLRCNGDQAAVTNLWKTPRLHYIPWSCWNPAPGDELGQTGESELWQVDDNIQCASL